MLACYTGFFVLGVRLSYDIDAMPIRNGMIIDV